MAGQKRLTVAIIAAMEIPEQGRDYIRDLEVKNLRIVVTEKGTRQWYWVAKTKGAKSPTYLKLGDYPDLPLARAREEAGRINTDVANGRRPEVRAAKTANDLTLSQVQRWYMDYVSKPHRESWQRDEDKFDWYWTDFRHRLLSSISHSEVVAHHIGLGAKRGKVSANNAVSYLSALFKTAITKLGYTGINPAVGVKRFEVQERERFLSPEEVTQFFAAVKTLRSQTAKDVLMLCLLTGARRSNVASMRWDEIDELGMLWTIPRKKAKKKRAMVLVLVPSAMQILASRKRLSPFVFPSSRAASGHFTWPKSSWATLCKRAGFTDVVMHDLRRTFASYQAGLNVSLHTIAKTLGHSSLASTKIYARLQLDSVREAVMKATGVMIELGNNQPPVKPDSDGK